MSNFSEISIEKIETDIMSVLYANLDMEFTQYTLFNKLLNDKYSDQYENITGTTTNSNFKSKFLLILRNLMLKYDDIKITKKDRIYSIVCKSSHDSPSQIYNNIDEISSKHNENNFSLKKSDTNAMYDYIFENNMKEYMDADPFEGNSVFHELIMFDNIEYTAKLINEGKFNFEINNDQNQRPIDMINSLEMSKIIISGLEKKITQIEKKHEQEMCDIDSSLGQLNDILSHYESTDYKNLIICSTSIFKFFAIKTKKYHFVKTYFISIILYYMMLRFFSM